MDEQQYQKALETRDKLEQDLKKLNKQIAEYQKQKKENLWKEIVELLTDYSEIDKISVHTTKGDFVLDIESLYSKDTGALYA